MPQNDPIKEHMQQRNSIKVCPNCDHENPMSAQSCAECGKRLPVARMVPPPAPITVVTQQQSTPPPAPEEPAFVTKIPSRNRLHQKSKWIVLTLIALALVVAVLFVSIISRMRSSGPTAKATPIPTQRTTPVHPNQTVSNSSPPNKLGEVLNANGYSIGVNDGSFAPFDVNRPTQTLKQKAADALKKGNSQAAISLWQQALSIQSNDVEALIYIENQRVLASGEPYITLVAGVAFTFTTKPPVADGSSESDLQGVYVAQHEFNTAHHGFQVRVLIANTGDNIPDTTAIAQQIVQIAHSDPTVVGVIGWRYSAYSLLAIPVLAKATIPMISSQSTSDELTNISPYFFRVVAPNSEEVQIAAPFVENTLGFKHPVIFYDPQDSYSQNLAQGFVDKFHRNGYPDIHEEAFTSDAKNQQANFARLMQDAIQYQPDGFIYTGRSNADTAFFQDALPTSGPLAHVKVFGGTGSYVAHPNSDGRWYFLAVAYHGAANTPIAQTFNQMYSADFNAHAQKKGGYYGYTLADDHAIVAYDATRVTLQAVLNSKKIHISAQELKQELSKVTSAQPFQGVSGLIAFGPNGNPINKPLFILFVNGSIQQKAICSINSGCHS